MSTSTSTELKKVDDEIRLLEKKKRELKKIDEQIRVLQQKKTTLVAKRRSETIINNNSNYNNDSNNNKKQKPTTNYPSMVKIAIGASYTSMNYDSFNSMYKRHVILGGILYQLSEDLKTLTPILYCPEYKDRNGCSSTVGFISVGGITCTKVGGEISASNKVFINDNEFFEEVSSGFINSVSIPTGTKILRPKQ